jgi:hypothetical protein
LLDKKSSVSYLGTQQLPYSAGSKRHKSQVTKSHVTFKQHPIPAFRTSKSKLTKTTITTSKTFHPSKSQIYYTMMNLNILLVFVALISATTGQVVDVTPPVELGAASNYAIVAKTGITTVPNSIVFGDVAVSPITGAAMTGFAMIMDPSGHWSTSPQINGKAYAADYATPIASKLTTAVIDMETAYNDAAGRPTKGGGLRTTFKDAFKAGDISSEILTPGVYTFTVPIHFSADITFQGDENDVFIIQTASSLLQAAGTKVRLLGGAQAKNIFWQVATSVTVGAGAQMQGVLLAKTHVTFMTGSYLNGRVLSQTACNLQMAEITEA